MEETGLVHADGLTGGMPHHGLVQSRPPGVAVPPTRHHLGSPDLELPLASLREHLSGPIDDPALHPWKGQTEGVPGSQRLPSRFQMGQTQGPAGLMDRATMRPPSSSAMVTTVQPAVVTGALPPAMGMELKLNVS